jgi:alpha-ketoglutarate-dependent taurine dioxygenase
MAHAKAVTSFVLIDSVSQPSDTARTAILNRYYTAGFALFELNLDDQNPADALNDFTQALNLGSAFVPPLYQFSNSTLYDDLGISTLAAAQEVDSHSRHPVFGSTDSIELHTDGTLQEMGEVPTSVLFCVRPADHGGATTVFQAVDAFFALEEADPIVASALLDSRALTKQASVNGSRETCTGPVFSYRNGELVTRYSVTDRDRWNIYEVEHLAEAKNEMARLVQLHTVYFHQISLGVGQGIILANDRVAHGRTGFSNSSYQTRRMLRVLFACKPH